MDVRTFPIDIRRKHLDRYLTVIVLAEVGQALGEPVTVMYTNNLEPGSVAGNHYHIRKREVFQVSHGRVEVHLLDVGTRDRVMVRLSSDPGSRDCRYLVVPSGVAHAVRNIGPGIARLNVFATDEPRKTSDDFPCVVLAP